MATFNFDTAFLSPPVVTGRRAQGFEIDPTVRTILFKSPSISCDGSVMLNGTAGENVRGWELGFFQLQFIETNYVTYRGRTSHDGGAKFSWSHNLVCRDTDERHPGLWYDNHKINTRTNRGVFQAIKLEANSNLIMETTFFDQPEQTFDTIVTNEQTGQRNFLHHADLAFHFCTLLVVKDPRQHQTVLKHFYWNVRWEAHFRPDTNGVPQMIRRDHFDFNVQRNVQNGIPNDARFRNRIFQRNLPVSNDMAAREADKRFSRDWSIT